MENNEHTLDGLQEDDIQRLFNRTPEQTREEEMENAEAYVDASLMSIEELDSLRIIYSLAEGIRGDINLPLKYRE